MEIADAWYFVKRFFVISFIVAITLIKFTAKAIYLFIKFTFLFIMLFAEDDENSSSKKSSPYVYGTGLGYNNYSFTRWWYWRRRWSKYWE